MGIFLVILIILISLLLAGIVLIQNPKGGGLDATFGGVSSNTFGAQRTTDFLEKGTWYLAVALLVASLATSLYFRSNGDSGTRSVTQGVAPITQPVNEAPAVPSDISVVPTNDGAANDAGTTTDPQPADNTPD
ncbi:MAG: preprotein translocase subunit SecG [Saprospiraceae bacterium]|nr:preprotein translocase subunit SecG [Saprospiraceae bacterium]